MCESWLAKSQNRKRDEWNGDGQGGNTNRMESLQVLT